MTAEDDDDGGEEDRPRVRLRIKQRISVRGASSDAALARAVSELKNDLKKSKAEDVRMIKDVIEEAKGLADEFADLVEELRRQKVIE
jgi:hypothetical protein